MTDTSPAIKAMIERLSAVRNLLSGFDENGCLQPNPTIAKATALLRQLLAERDVMQDKIDGLSIDLDSAIVVMRRRVSGESDIASMGEWLGLNYPAIAGKAQP
jgi:hypothetical protein